MKNLWITINDIPDSYIREIKSFIYNYLVSQHKHRIGLSWRGCDNNGYLDIELIDDDLDYLLWELKRLVQDLANKVIWHDKYEKLRSQYSLSIKPMNDEYVRSLISSLKD